MLPKGKFIWYFVTTTLVIIPIVLFAENNSSSNSSIKDLPPDAAPKSKQVIRFMSPEPRTLDSAINDYDTEDTIIPFEPLLRRDPSWYPEPAAADRYESSPDGKTWTFYLRKGARWSDGRPVTAHDFVYSFRRMLDPTEANPYGFFYYDFKNAQAINRGDIKDLTQLGVTAKDDYTLIIETEKPAAYLPYIVSYGNALPVPQWQVEKHGRKWTRLENIVSNSGFKVSEWLTGSHMTFVPDPMYNGPHMPLLEKVIHPFRDAAVATILPYENNEVDRELVDVTDMPRIMADPNLAPDLVKVAARGSWYLFFRTRQPPFDDVRVREAFTRAIDRNVICEILLGGTAVPAYSMIPPEFEDFNGPALKSYQSYNPSRAKELIKEAGYPRGRGFPRQELWLRAPTPTIKRVSEAIMAMLKDNLGIDITIRAADRTMYMNNMYNWRMNLGLIVFYADYLDPRNMLDMIWHSQPRGFGRSDWLNTKFDRLVENAAAELDVDKRRALYFEAEEVMVSDYAGGFLFHPVNLELRKRWVKGIPKNPDGTVGAMDYTRAYIAK
tara:strand:- start:48423 stop:50078 length:1656 start_codon:yes stop_codon:yes gene_type:complete